MTAWRVLASPKTRQASCPRPEPVRGWPGRSLRLALSSVALSVASCSNSAESFSWPSITLRALPSSVSSAPSPGPTWRSPGHGDRPPGVRRAHRVAPLLVNLLSISAAWGVLVLVWQKGYGSHALWGIPATQAVLSWLPLIVFAFLFGL